MLTYRHTDTLEMVGFSDFDYVGCVDDKKSTSGYIFMMVEGAVSCKSMMVEEADTYSFFYYEGRLCGVL